MNDRPSGFSAEEYNTCLYEGDFDRYTGEIHEYAHNGYEDLSAYKNGNVLGLLLTSETYKDFILSLENIEISCKEELNWCDSAVSALFSLSERQGMLFHCLANNLTTRNIVFIDNLRLCKDSKIDRTNLSKAIKDLEGTGNIVEMRKDVCKAKRNYRVVFLNPTLVWKGYFHRGGKSSTDDLHFSSKHRFSTLHDNYVQKWVNGDFHKLAGKVR